MPEVLPEDYYLDNFKFLLDFVVREHYSLLSNEEKEFYRTFKLLSQDACKLYVRLTNRKGPYFRVDKLNYMDPQRLNIALKLLIKVKFIFPAVSDSGWGLKLCSKAELLSIDECSNLTRYVKRQFIEDYLASRKISPVKALSLEVVEVAQLEVLMVYRLLFFGNFHQDMKEFVVHELVNPFEKYQFCGGTNIFRSRKIIDELIVLKSRSEEVNKLKESEGNEGPLIELILNLPKRNPEPVLGRSYDRIVNGVARYLERRGMLEDAAEVYSKAQGAPARERQARIFARLERPEDSIKFCSSILANPCSEEELEFAHAFGERLSQKHSLKTKNHFGFHKIDIQQEEIYILDINSSVELSACNHFQKLGYQSFYVENNLLRGLFGLCFWDIIYAPIEGAFFNPFQRRPADLYTQDFVANRHSMITARLKHLKKSGFRKLAESVYTRKYGVANTFVNWRRLNEVLLEAAFERIPFYDLVLIFEKMLVDLKNNASGFPDLIVFGDEGYQMIEIKGPGDKLQKNQARWCRYFELPNLPSNGVHVKYPEATGT